MNYKPLVGIWLLFLCKETLAKSKTDVLYFIHNTGCKSLVGSNTCTVFFKTKEQRNEISLIPTNLEMVKL